MGANKPWLQSAVGRRQHGARARRRVLIVCEDSQSACDYFKAFKVDAHRAEVRAVGTGMNTDSLVEEADSLKQRAISSGEPYNEVWWVFDRDSFPLQNYDRAFQLANANGIKVAWANEAFELWYLLHFNYHDTGISRDVYRAKLKPYLDYDKADKTIYEQVKPQQETALRNARHLERYWNELGDKFPARKNPSTSVHKLVEFLNELAGLGSVD